MLGTYSYPGPHLAQPEKRFYQINLFMNTMTSASPYELKVIETVNQNFALIQKRKHYSVPKVNKKIDPTNYFLLLPP